MNESYDVSACERCPELVNCRSQIVNGVGNIDASIMFIGEAPGENEDKTGQPFVGRSGSVLDNALKINGLTRSDVRISNCARCRPPENRDPTAEELDNCRSHLEHEVDAVNPDVIVALGKVPSQNLLGRSVAVTKESGRKVNTRIGETPCTVVICVHPAATLYDSSQKDSFKQAIGTAVEMADDSSGQSRLGDF